MESSDQTRLVRKIRITLVLVAMLVGVAVIAVIGVLFYWNSYLLGSRGDDSFKRGPYVVGVSLDPAMAYPGSVFCVNGCECM